MVFFFLMPERTIGAVLAHDQEMSPSGNGSGEAPHFFELAPMWSQWDIPMVSGR
jgi:hypothetical protein